MKRVFLFHFIPAQAAERLERLRSLGYNAEFFDAQAFPKLTEVREHPPDVFLIDLGRRPSYGQEIGAGLKRYKRTRTVPIVFIEGDPERIAKVRNAIPGAVFTTWEKIGETLAALPATIPAPPKPPPSPSGYSATPLPKKLGIKPGMHLRLFGEPEYFEELLGPLPEGTEITNACKGDLAVVFATTAAELEVRFNRATKTLTDKAHLWIAWPKKASKVPTDLDESRVREFGLGMGWVDYKVCAIDATWSGHVFARKKGRDPI